MTQEQTCRVLAQQWVSVDGFASGVTDEQELFAQVPEAADAASMRHNERLIPAVTEVLLGRRSYETFSQFWPTADVPVAPHVNGVRKTVFSRSLTEAPWGDHAPATVVDDAVEHVKTRRREGPGLLLLWGSLELMAELVRAGELDELELFVAPVVMGAGRPLLPPGLHVDLEPLEVEASDGLLRTRYAVTR